VVVKCKIDPPHYRQGDARWADEHYDNAYDKDGKEIKVRALGCALSSMAMAMTALGDTVNPGQLNQYMKDSSGYDGRSVKWGTMEKHSGNKVNIVDYVRNSNFPDTTKATNPSVLDRYLAICNLAIVKVLNANTGNEHWVVITGKKNNTYTILDPGRGETNLNGYGGKLWSYVVVGK
jgi:ABC-type bacteriocin/lantibiotic exporter with double-glycine peptidase domain